MLAIELPEGNECDATLDVYLTPQSQEPEYSFEAKLTHLDPVEELSGVQARCNALGHNCGTVDGVMGAKRVLALNHSKRAINCKLTACRKLGQAPFKKMSALTLSF